MTTVPSTGEDPDLGSAVALLRATPTHERRSDEQLRRWATIALAYGDELAAEPPPDLPVVEAAGGVDDAQLVLARHRGGRVVIHPAALARVAEMAAARGWPVTVPALRAAAIAHEHAHHRIDTAELDRRLDHTAWAWGRWRLRGHVAGAAEIAAHRYAHRRSDLAVSPLWLSSALTGGS